MRDDKLSLAALGGLAYLIPMTLHEGVGHAVACVLLGGHPLITPCATQCDVRSRAMVLAGPLLNLAGGIVAGSILHRVSPARPRAFWLLWLLMATNLFQFAGYLALGGLLGFGDWATAADGIASPWIWRPLFLVAGCALYYGAMRAAGRRLPGMGDDVAPDRRLRSLTLVPYLGAGLVAVCAGLFNPLGGPLLLALGLPVASSFGAYYGLLPIGDFRRKGAGEAERALAPVTRSAAWLAVAAVAIALFLGLIGPGLRVRP
jgi:hypothetical protein